MVWKRYSIFDSETDASITAAATMWLVDARRGGLRVVLLIRNPNRFNQLFIGCCPVKHISNFLLS